MNHLGDDYRWAHQQVTAIHCDHFFPDAFRDPQLSLSPPVMDDYGREMSSALKRRLAEPQSRRVILNAISHIVEDVSDVSVGELGHYLIAQVKHQAVDDDGMPTSPESRFTFRQESDGTLRILGILVGVYQDMTEGRVLAFEEPELAVHPRAMTLFCELFDEAALTRRIIITTQSPDLIAHFGSDELRVVGRGTCRRRKQDRQTGAVSDRSNQRRTILGRRPAKNRRSASQGNGRGHGDYGRACCPCVKSCPLWKARATLPRFPLCFITS